MSLSDLALLLHFMVAGVKALKAFIVKEEVRQAFAGLKNAQTDKDKEAIAQKLASLLAK